MTRYMADLKCMKCGKPSGMSSECPSCKLKEEGKVKHEFKDKLKKMTLEERIERIEGILYDQQVAKNRARY